MSGDPHQTLRSLMRFSALNGSNAKAMTTSVKANRLTAVPVSEFQTVMELGLSITARRSRHESCWLRKEHTSDWSNLLTDNSFLPHLPPPSPTPHLHLSLSPLTSPHTNSPLPHLTSPTPPPPPVSFLVPSQLQHTFVVSHCTSTRALPLPRENSDSTIP